MAVIDKIDIRRMQVLVESLIVEVSADKASELGVNWAVADGDLDNAVGVTRFDSPVAGGGGIIGLVGALEAGIRRNWRRPPSAKALTSASDACPTQAPASSP